MLILISIARRSRMLIVTCGKFPKTIVKSVTDLVRMCLEAYFSEKCDRNFQDNVDSDSDDDSMGFGGDDEVGQEPPASGASSQSRS